MTELEKLSEISKDKKLLKEFLNIPLDFWKYIGKSANIVNNSAKNRVISKTIFGDYYRLNLNICIIYNTEHSHNKIYTSVSDNIAIEADFRNIVDYLMYVGKYPYNHEVLTEYEEFYKISMYGFIKFRNLLMKIYKDQENIINSYFNQIIVRYLNRSTLPMT